MSHIAKVSRLLMSVLFMGSAAPVSADKVSSPERNITGFESIDEAQPLWEIGFGGGVVDVPDYPASSERNFIGLALPYVIYRGDFFRLGDGSARAILVENNNFEIDISVGGSFAAESNNNSVREGMPELDFLFEVGPQIIYRLRDFNFTNGGVGRLKVNLQTRAVFSTDFSQIDHQGFVFQPELSYQQRGVLFEDSAFDAAFSLVFATEKLQDYFYQVDNEFVSNNRSAFNASGGFLGAEFSTGISFSLHENIRAFAGGSLRVHKGASNTDSPLFEKDITYSIGIGFIWRLYKSDAYASWEHSV
uniref:Putative outer membrane protein n=1 Tax=Rheinheimera sp. BAL341 TaxID=1708203 RepID=A0A486XI46_9GAMM